MSRVDLRGADATEAVIRFATTLTLDKVPQLVVDRAVDAFTDTVGVLLGGSIEHTPQSVLRYLRKYGQIPGVSPLLGRTEKATPAGAALYHGACAHALDYDDTGHPGNVHPSSHVLPALLALADLSATPGPDLLVAYLVGLEVENKVGMCLPSSVRNLNMHPTGVVGPLAAAAAGSRLVGLDKERTRMALGIAGSFAAGLRANNGTDVKPLHSARAAEGAVVAVRLAEEGVISCEAILEAEYGFLDAFRAEERDCTGPDVSAISELGSTWELEKDFGIALKPFPCCACIHPAIEAALLIEGRIGRAEITSVTIETSAYAYSIVADPDPDTVTRARFSMQYCVASALTHGAVRLSTFTKHEFEDALVRSLMARTSLEVGEGLREDLEHPATVTVALEDGRIESAHVPYASGKPARWVSKDQLAAKFRDCSGTLLKTDESEVLFGWLQGLLVHRDVSELPPLTVPSDRR